MLTGETVAPEERGSVSDLEMTAWSLLTQQSVISLSIKIHRKLYLGHAKTTTRTPTADRLQIRLMTSTIPALIMLLIPIQGLSTSNSLTGSWERPETMMITSFLLTKIRTSLGASVKFHQVKFNTIIWIEVFRKYSWPLPTCWRLGSFAFSLF